jgi:uncharacterized protein YdeI (YjbR/CyaY-like superfamily)
MKNITSVDSYISNQKYWNEELNVVREILCETGINETVKWGSPVYTHGGKNIVGLGAFKSYFGLWFFQGALLKDTGKKLINAQEGKTKALRQWRFTSMDQIDPVLIQAYVLEATNNQKEGKEIKPERKPLIVPAELKMALVDNNLENTFDQLNLSEKRDFAEYVQEAKRIETRQKRIQKIVPMIREGIGLNDRYKKK